MTERVADHTFNREGKNEKILNSVIVTEQSNNLKITRMAVCLDKSLTFGEYDEISLFSNGVIDDQECGGYYIATIRNSEYHTKKHFLIIIIPIF